MLSNIIRVRRESFRGVRRCICRFEEHRSRMDEEWATRDEYHWPKVKPRAPNTSPTTRWMRLKKRLMGGTRHGCTNICFCV